MGPRGTGWISLRVQVALLCVLVPAALAAPRVPPPADLPVDEDISSPDIIHTSWALEGAGGALTRPVEEFPEDEYDPEHDAFLASDGGPVAARARRSTVVFRPLFATRERDAERLERREYWKRYWANERRRQGQY